MLDDWIGASLQLQLMCGSSQSALQSAVIDAREQQNPMSLMVFDFEHSWDESVFFESPNLMKVDTRSLHNIIYLVIFTTHNKA